jgi:hypothetical protein
MCTCIHPSICALCSASYVMALDLAQSGAGVGFVGLVNRRACVCVCLPSPHCTRNARTHHGDTDTRALILHFSSSRARHDCIAAAYLYLPLRQQRPRRTGSVTHRVPVHQHLVASVCIYRTAQLWLLVRPLTDTDIVFVDLYP